MPSISTVKSTFERLIDGQRKVISAFSSEERALRAHKKAETGAFQSAFSAIFPDEDAPSLAALTALSAAHGADFAGSLEAMQEKDRAARAAYAGMEALHGTLDTVRAQARDATSTLQVTEGGIASDKDSLYYMTSCLRETDRHNKKYPDRPLTAATESSFAGFSLWPFLFSPSYRSGRSALQNFRPIGFKAESFSEGWRKRAQTSASLDAAIRSLPGARRLVAELGERTRTMEKYAANFSTPESRLQKLAENVRQKLSADSGFAAGFVKAFGEEASAPLLLGAAKLSQYDKMQDALSRQKAQAETVLASLENPMPKIRKGARKKPSHNVRIDLDTIERQVKNGQAVLGANIGHAERAREAVGSYAPAANADMFNFQQLMLIYLIMDMNTDAAFVHSTFTLDPETASAAGIDLPGLFPATDGGLNVGDAFNGAASGLDSLPDPSPALSGLSVDVPSFDIPTIDIPTIDIPSGTFDPGSYGGFDSGPGF